MNIQEMIKNKFPNLIIFSEKIETNNQLVEILDYLKNTPELSFDILLSIIAIDYSEYIELIYPLVSTYLNERINISIKINSEVDSVIGIYNSAYFDECEIYDLFGVNFIGNNNLKRLFMPSTWIGHPLRKNYELKDERLSWNG